MYLDRIRVLYQDAFGPASSYSINEVLMIISTVVEGHHGIKLCWTGSLSFQFLQRHGCAYAQCIPVNQIPWQQILCSKYPSQHLTKTHFGQVRTPQPGNEADPALGVFSVYNSPGILFLDGTVNIGQTGMKRFIKSKLLINTGAFVPSSISISEDFFCSHLGGELRRLPSLSLM